MTTVPALSTAPAVARMMSGDWQYGECVGQGYVDFGDYVVAITAPGAPRMPNGIESTGCPQPGDRVVIGRDRLEFDDTVLTPGPLWDPRPTPHVNVRLYPAFTPDPDVLSGWGDGLTPFGDDVLIGYAAARWLYGGRPALFNAPGTTKLARTLLSHARWGEVPQPLHRLVEDGDIEPLLHFGASSGTGMLLGFAAGGAGRPWHPSAGAPHFARMAVRLPDGLQTYNVMLYWQRDREGWRHEIRRTPPDVRAHREGSL